MSIKRRPLNRLSTRQRRANKICFSRIRREVHVTSQAVLILRPATESSLLSGFQSPSKEPRGVLEGEG